ncbi:copper chaperone CopZ [Pseudochelatococcus lubricantis]|uniref:Copper chaperone CopZ n=1 Tax=Pseudochelatococcus lubricantis TaxID=1538102 RepID=A0ABX0V1F2_9HYPH|nr:heavy-metal-associated domain-containing protein [Pseudochelatococcus lubricantis]NIJ58130.1 copper chaperone CopZ [Pseudochelatococcus lubricantis]
MPTLKVPKMNCEGCAATIEKAVKSIDPQAKVTADLAAKTVAIETTVDPQAVSRAVKAAGYDNAPAV